MKFIKFVLVVCASILLGLIVSCSPKKTFTKTSVSMTQLPLTILTKTEFPHASVFVLSKIYVTPNLEWLTKEYYPEFKKELFDKGVVSWDESFNCSQFARYYTSYLQTKFFIENYHTEKAWTLAVGNLCYLIGGDSTKGHEINCIMDEHDKIILIEPQNGNIVTLTEVEKNSVFFVLW